MELENIKVGNGLELSLVGNPLPESSFEELVDNVKTCYINMGINPENMHLEYQRYSNAKSVLAIKLSEGSNQDKENYMFIGSSAHEYSGKIHCDVFMHADAKSAQRAMHMSNMISRKVVGFFEQTEQELHSNGMHDMEFSVTIPLFDEKHTEQSTKKESKWTKFLKLISTKR